MYPTLQSKIESVFLDFKQFKNDVTELEVFCEWSKNVEKLYFNIDTLERLRNESLKPLFNLVCSNSQILELIKSHPYAMHAMKEFDKINVFNEGELIDWLFKFEENELDFSDYIKVDNWQQNNLILHSSDNSVVINCKGYSESLMFSEIHPKYYWELIEKYKITEEQFETAKQQYGVKAYDLRTFLKIHKV